MFMHSSTFKDQYLLKVAEDDIAFKLAILKKIIAFERQYMLL